MFEKKKASRILMDYIEGRGSGVEIDDLVHSKLTDYEEEAIVEPLLLISNVYSNREYIIGISNPASFEDIRRLSLSLKERGL